MRKRIRRNRRSIRGVGFTTLQHDSAHWHEPPFGPPAEPIVEAIFGHPPKRRQRAYMRLLELNSEAA